MSRRQSVTTGGAGHAAAGSKFEDVEQYLSVTFGGCRIVEVRPLWLYAVAAALECGGRRRVAVVELVGGEWPEVVAVFDEGAPLGRIKRAMERVVDKLGVCDDFETYDLCTHEESGRAAEEVLEMLGEKDGWGVFGKDPAELAGRVDYSVTRLTDDKASPNRRRLTPWSSDKESFDKSLDEGGRE